MSENKSTTNQEEGSGDNNEATDNLYSSIFGVVGGDEETAHEILEQSAEEFVCQGGKIFVEDGREYSVEDFEREKTPEEIKVVSNIVERLPDFVEKYGGRGIYLDPIHFHFLDRKKFLVAGLKAKNFYDEVEQFAGIFDLGDLLANAQGVVHEGLHFNSFQTLEMRKDGFVDTRRSGFSMRNNETNELYFADINEAVIEELVKRFDMEFFGDIPELNSYLQERREFRERVEKAGKAEEINLIDDVAYVAPKSLITKDAGLDGMLYTYPGLRRDLNFLMNDILEANKDRFDSLEKVFEIFARATMSGKMLDIAKLIDKTYKKQGSFRELGKRTKSSER